MSSVPGSSLSDFIRKSAADLGFGITGIARSRTLSEHMPVLRDWCTEGMHSDMNYLCRQPEKRLDPTILFPGTKSVIVTGLSYSSSRKQGGDSVPVLARYAYGEDYHVVILRKLNKLLELIRIQDPVAEGKAFCDTAPIPEKAWGREAGLGWPGKHSVLINRKLGSFFFIGILLLNRELEYDKPYAADHCGSCRLCMDACPTAAINGNRTIDTRKCIAYLTIESKEPVPEKLAPLFGERVFGCDICQEICPWNKEVDEHNTPEFRINDELAGMTADEWKNLSRADYKRLLGRGPLSRKKYDIFMKNISILSSAGKHS